MERRIEAELGVEGALSAKVSERSFGQTAVEERRLFKSGSRPQYVKQIGRWVTEGAPSAQIAKVEPADDAKDGKDGKFALDVEFNAPTYAQSMRGKLLVFKPAIVSRRASIFLTDANRKHPVVLEGEAYDEIVKIKLPNGFEVDELPDSTEINRPFGNYAATYEVKDGQLTFKRTLILKSATIPVDQYAAVRSFFERIRTAEQAPVVLAKK